MFYKQLAEKEKLGVEEQVLQLCELYFGQEKPFQRVFSSAHKHATAQELRHGKLFIASDPQDELAGFCITCPCHYEERLNNFEQKQKMQLACFVAAVIVQKNYQRQGHAYALLAKALRHEKGLFALITPKNNKAAIALYQKIGMKIVEEFVQQEQHIQTKETFDLPRVIMVGDVDQALAALQSVQ